MEKSWVREAFQAYPHVWTLGRCQLAQTEAITDCLWLGDETDIERVGQVVQTILLWAIEQLARKNSHYQQSAAILRLRYVEGLTVAVCQARLQAVESTIKARQRTAIERVTALLNSAETPHAHITKIRYEKLTTTQQEWMRFFAVLIRPISPQIETLASWELTPHLPTLLEQNWLLQNESGLLTLQPAAQPYLQTLIVDAQPYHEIATRYYVAHADSAAIYHGLKAGEWELSAELILQHHPTLDTKTLDTYLSELVLDPLPPATKTAIYLLLGQVAERCHNLHEALSAYQAALVTDDNRVRGEACYRMGRVQQRLNSDMTLSCYEDALHFLADCPQDRLYTQLLIDYAWVLIQQKQQFLPAKEQLEAAQALIEPDDRALHAQLYNTWGEWHIRQDDPEACIAARKQAWYLAHELDDALLMIK